jgi:hypothetical protein
MENNLYTEDDVKFLRKFYYSKPKELKRFPERSWEAIGRKC